MNRIQTACYCLIASTVALSGLLLIQLSERVQPNAAEAEMVIARENFTLMTADVRSGEEALFVLDNATGTLLVYRLDVSRGQMVPADALRLSEAFSADQDGDRDRGRSRGRR